MKHQKQPTLQMVDVDDLLGYPISAKDRLDSHFFLQWNLKRWRGSNFRKRAYTDPEVGWYGFELFCFSQDETPVGTLPCDDDQLAFMLHLPLERWLSLLKRDLSPLNGWERVRCDNGEIRLAHPVVTEIAVDALKGARSNANAKAKMRDRKRLKDLTSMVERLGAKQLLAQPGFIDRLDAWLNQHQPDANRTEAVIREALDSVCATRP
jgi:hypothetical protein